MFISDGILFSASDDNSIKVFIHYSEFAFANRVLVLGSRTS